MKKTLIGLFAIMIVAACNSGNEGSDSIILDTSRVADSLRLADSLRRVDSSFNFEDTTGTGTGIDTTMP